LQKVLVSLGKNKMRFQEIVEAGLVGKLGNAAGAGLGAAVKGIGGAIKAATKTGQQVAQGAKQWQGTGMLGSPNKGSDDQPTSDTTNPALKDVDANDLKQILAAALQGQKLDGKLLQVAQSLEQKL
jgi:hypothetical protein